MNKVNRIMKTIKFVTKLNIVYKRLPIPKKELWLKNQIEQMGPTYIKIGQFLASRPDVIEDKIIMSTLQSLYEDITPVSWNEMEKTIPVNDIIIEKVPIASASIGQVYRGKTKDGSDVVVKIKRPNVDEDIRLDLEILESYIRVASIVFGKTDPKIIDSISILQDLRIMFSKESDFIGEVKNMVLMSSTLPNVNIPVPLQSYCTDNMIVMNYIPSIQITDNLSKETRKQYSNMLMNIFIDQFLKHGIMHGDPHEGNIKLSNDGSEFVMYDFGNVVQLDKKTRSLMKMLVFEIISDNVDGVIDVISEMPDIITIRNEENAKKMIQLYIKYIKTVDINVLKEGLMSDQNLPFKFADIIFQVTRVFGMVEGICLQLDSDFKYESVFINHIETLVIDEEFLKYKIKTDFNRFMTNFL